MGTRTTILALAMMLGWVSLADAQESTPSSADEAAPDETPDDPPEVDEAYQRAIDAFASNDWNSAVAAFEDVAQRTVESGRRAAATELASQARLRAEAEAPQPPTEGEELTTPPPPPPEGYAETAPPPPATEHERLEREERDQARGEFVAGTTVLGLGLWGWATPLAFGAEDEKLIIGTYMVVAAGSFFVPFLLTQDAVVTPAESTLSLAFGVEGVWVGSMIYGMVTAFDIDDDELRGLAGTMALTSLAGTVGGYVWADLTEMDEGMAHALYSGLIFGGAWALGLELLVEGEDWAEDDTRVRLNLAGLLTGAGLGVLGGKLLADERTYTWGDMEVVQTAGIVGAYLAAVPVIISETQEPRLIAPLLMLGSVGGIIAGDMMVDGVDLTDGEAWLVNTGAYVGGLIGAGVAFLASGDDFDLADAKLMVTLSAATAIGGGALTYALIDPVPEGAETGPPPVSAHLVPTFATDGQGELAPGAALIGTF